MVKLATIRIILSIVSNSWPLHQLDVSNAFLQRTLSEAVHMDPLQGFANSKYPTHVYKLHKAIYGLRQAPHTWYNELQLFVVASSFVQLQK